MIAAATSVRRHPARPSPLRLAPLRLTPLGAAAPHPRLRLPGGWPTGRRQPSAAVRRRRAVLVLMAIAACGTLLGAGSLAGAGQGPPPAPRAVVLDASPVMASTYLVQPGDTLWSVARRLQPEGDVRPLVTRLRAASGGGPLAPGQRLRLPV